MRSADANRFPGLESVEVAIPAVEKFTKVLLDIFISSFYETLENRYSYLFYAIKHRS